MKRFLIKDISSITLIKEKLFDKLVNVSNMCICDYIDELDMTSQNTIHIDIGIGIIDIHKDDDSLEYRFIPSATLENNIISTLENKQNPLVLVAETKLNDKITKTYKELV